MLRNESKMLQPVLARCFSRQFSTVLKTRGKRFLLGTGLGISGLIAYSQPEFAKISKLVEDEAITVANDLMKDFEKDVKKEIHKEVIKLENILLGGEISRDNVEKDSNSNASKSRTAKCDEDKKVDIIKEDTADKKVDIIKEETADILTEVEDIIDDSKSFIDDIEDAAKEATEVFHHMKLLGFKMLKLMHILITMMIPVIATFHFIK